MRPARSTALALVVACLALGAPLLAQARRPAPPRCPARPPAEGAHCARVGMGCSFRGTHEGARDRVCTCALDAADRLAWHCESVGTVYRD